jgi:hypothetical protein
MGRLREKGAPHQQHEMVVGEVKVVQQAVAQQQVLV